MNATIQTQLLDLANQVIGESLRLDQLRQDGLLSTHYPNVHVFHQKSEHASQPLLYEPGLVLVLVGEKQVNLGPRRYVCNSTRGLLLTGAYPVLCSAQGCTTAPLIGMYIALTRAQVAKLLDQVDHHRSVAHSQAGFEQQVVEAEYAPLPSAGMSTFELTSQVQQAASHLLAALAEPVSAKLFGEDRCLALVYALLNQTTTEQQLRQWISQDGSYAQFLKATAYIQTHLSQNFNVQGLAAVAGLSESSLNRAFRRFAADSPMQYVKKVRLHQAHLQLRRSNCTVQLAAHAVGYESVSQFSREYKRYFGHSPKRGTESRVADSN